ncbi:MAG: aldo/keto reductase [Christensenellales bacterium]
MNNAIVLNNGTHIPRIGLGMFKSKDEEAVQAMQWAVDAGYRHFDTAAFYRNEKDVGRGIARCGIPREELFITSKLWPDDMVDNRQEPALLKSLEELGLTYLDLYLLHWPVGDVASSWKVLEKYYQDGVIKAIGISNFQPCHIEWLMEKTHVKPTVNQIESNPYFPQLNTIAYCQRNGIAVEAWGPIGYGEALNDPYFMQLAQKYNKTAAQVILRWHYQRDVIVIPKSVHKERIIENIRITDFEISQEDMKKISSFDRGYSKRGYFPVYSFTDCSIMEGK